MFHVVQYSTKNKISMSMSMSMNQIFIKFIRYAQLAIVKIDLLLPTSRVQTKQLNSFNPSTGPSNVFQRFVFRLTIKYVLNLSEKNSHITSNNLY